MSKLQDHNSKAVLNQSLWFLPSLCFPYILPIRFLSFSNLTSFSGFMTQAYGIWTQNKDFNVFRNWENSNTVRANTIYNPFSVYAPRCIFYAAHLKYTAEFPTLAMVKWNSKNSDDYRREMNLVWSFYNIQYQVTKNVKVPVFDSHLTTQCLTAMNSELKLLENVGLENILQPG